MIFDFEKLEKTKHIINTVMLEYFSTDEKLKNKINEKITEERSKGKYKYKYDLNLIIEGVEVNPKLFFEIYDKQFDSTIEKITGKIGDEKKKYDKMTSDFKSKNSNNAKFQKILEKQAKIQNLQNSIDETLLELKKQIK